MGIEALSGELDSNVCIVCVWYNVCFCSSSASALTKALLLFHRSSQQAKELHTSVAQIIALWTGQYKKNLYESINFCFNQCATNQIVDEDSATLV